MLSTRLALRRLSVFASLSVAAFLAACSPVKLLNATIPTGQLRETTDIAYGNDPRQKLDIYVPRAPARSASGYPVVVFFYGGSWQNGRRQDYLFVAEALASRGYIAVVPDYRTWPEVIFPAFIDDAATAVRWAHDHAPELGGDPHRFFLMGHSAGAQIAVLLATDRRYLARQQMSREQLAGVIGLAGPYDFLPLQDSTLEKIFPPAIREESQPIRFVTRGEPPMLLAAGTDDTIVDPGNTVRMANALKAAGDTVEVLHYPGAGHIKVVASLAAPLRAGLPVLNDVATFIDAH